MKTRAFFSIGLAGVIAFAALHSRLNQGQQAAEPFWSDLGAGKYAVGFRILYQHDHSRNWLKTPHGQADPGRPIRVSVWYPALPSSSARPMNYGDYLHHNGPDDFREINQELDKSDTDSWLSDLREISPQGDAIFAKLLSLPVAAYRDAPAATERFPLLLFSGGKLSRADANVELGEYLASYGYVVATVPQLGPSDQEIELGSSPKELSLHADDFDAALSLLHGLTDIDFGHIASAGHSAGGEVAVELALRHPEIAAVIGLDASFGMTGGARIFRLLPEYAPRRKVNAALLDLRRADGSQGVKLDLGAIDSLQWPDVYRVLIPNAFHGDFTEWGSTGLLLSVPMPPNPDGHTRQRAYEVNRHVCHAVLDFLDGRLRNRKEALQDLANEFQNTPGTKFSHIPGSASSGSGK